MSELGKFLIAFAGSDADGDRIESRFADVSAEETARRDAWRVLPVRPERGCWRLCVANGAMPCEAFGDALTTLALAERAAVDARARGVAVVIVWEPPASRP